MKILYEHHTILQQLNTTGKKMSAKIFDYYISISSADEEPQSSVALNSSVDACNTSQIGLKNQPDIELELESFNELNDDNLSSGIQPKN
jgi:hypothetical protein